jgi:hypothetical protein
MTRWMVLAVGLCLAGCTSPGDVARGTGAGLMEGWCRQASGCEVGARRDPLAERPAYERALGAPAQSPFPMRRAPAR